MQYERISDGTVIEAYKYNGNVYAGDEVGMPQWVKDAILITHRIWFDPQWNMKVKTAYGTATCKTNDYLVYDDDVLDVISHDTFKIEYRKIK